MMVATSSNAVNSLRASAERATLRLFVALGALAFVLLLISPAVGLPSSNSASAQTQMQLNKEACDEYKNVDVEMNAVYRRITRDYRRDPGFIAALRKAQLAWIRYRDAQLESIYPGDASQYGSINTMCRCTNLAEITKARTQILNRWVDGIEESDVCAGSVKVK